MLEEEKQQRKMVLKNTSQLEFFYARKYVVFCIYFFVNYSQRKKDERIKQSTINFLKGGRGVTVNELIFLHQVRDREQSCEGIVLSSDSTLVSCESSLGSCAALGLSYWNASRHI
jgi:hypothetical protein